MCCFDDARVDFKRAAVLLGSGRDQRALGLVSAEVVSAIGCHELGPHGVVLAEEFLMFYRARKLRDCLDVLSSLDWVASALAQKVSAPYEQGVADWAAKMGFKLPTSAILL
jgi:hypothetical protein